MFGNDEDRSGFFADPEPFFIIRDSVPNPPSGFVPRVTVRFDDEEHFIGCRKLFPICS